MAKINKRLLISDHYDELVNQIDLYTEEILEKIPKDAVITELSRFPPGSNKDDDDWVFKNDETFEGPYTDRYDFSGEEDVEVKVVLGETKVADYVNLIRSKAIEEIQKAREENLEQLAMRPPNPNSNPNLIEIEEQEAMDITSDSDDSDCINETDLEKVTMEKLRYELFQDKFCFFVMLEQLPYDPNFKYVSHLDRTKNKSIFQMYTIVVDFYMSLDDIDLLEKFLNSKIAQDDDEYDYGVLRVFDRHFSRKYSEYDLTEKHLLVHLLWKYLCDRLVDHPKFGNEVIKVTKEKLLSIQKCLYYHYNIHLKQVEIPGALFDFSRLKSIKIKSTGYDGRKISEIVSLKGLKNLEYLILGNARFEAKIFDDLVHLRSLRLDNCDLSTIGDAFVYLPNLKSLVLNQDGKKSNELTLDLDFSPMSKLEELKLYIKLNQAPQLKLLSVNNDLISLQLKSCFINQKAAEYFFKEVLAVRFPYLAKLDINDNPISSINKQWFAGKNALKELNMTLNKLESINPEDFLHLENLEVLKLANNNIRSLKEDTFSYLKSLRSLDLSKNYTQSVHSNAFRGLDRLEELNINCFGVFRTTKTLNSNWLKYLKNLTKLSVRESQIAVIDSDVFAHMPKLQHLDLYMNRISLNSKMLRNLANLKTLDLGSCNLKVIEPNSFKTLSSLEKLELNGNMLQKLDPDAFSGLGNLRSLNLSSNKLQDINKDTFKHLKKIEFISLDSNPELNNKFISELYSALNIRN